MAAALYAVGLSHLVDQLDIDSNWAQRLSGGEQQRLGFARVLLTRPDIVFLDEATSALDEPSESELYRLLREAEWHPTIVSVGHHRSLKRFHEAVVDLSPGKIAGRGAIGATGRADERRPKRRGRYAPSPVRASPKLDALRELGVEPHPVAFERSDEAAALETRYADVAAGA